MKYPGVATRNTRRTWRRTRPVGAEEITRCGGWRAFLAEKAK